MRPNVNLMKATLTGALGGLLFGFDTVVISGAIDALVRLYGLSPRNKGWTVAIALVGTVVGALCAGVVGQKLGSRETLRITAMLYFDLGHRQRSGMELAGADGLSLFGRVGYRRIVGSGSGLHCRAGSGQVAWAAGGHLPVQRGAGHIGGLPLEFRDKAAAPGSGGVALAGWRGCDTGVRFSGAALSGFRAARAGAPRGSGSTRLWLY